MRIYKITSKIEMQTHVDEAHTVQRWGDVERNEALNKDVMIISQNWQRNKRILRKQARKHDFRGTVLYPSPILFLHTFMPPLICIDALNTEHTFGSYHIS